MARNVPEGYLEKKINRIGFGIGAFAGTACYSGIMFGALRDAPSYEEAAARGILYGVFAGPLLSAIVCELTRSVSTEILRRRYLRKGNKP